ncbi:MAG: YHS domain-containing protein, partial [Deltaproteobacteria bacterium]|nr:YHS domain-containing protein [Deltaproteobacteria bacterium]
MQNLMLTMMLLAMTFAAAGNGWAADSSTAIMDKPEPKQQVVCPVQGSKINKNLFVDYQGQRIYFCCPECIPIFEKNPEVYLQK